MNLVNDFVLNDDDIFDQDPVFVRKAFGEDETFMNQLLKVLDEADLDMMVQNQYREFILRALFRIYQVNVDRLQERMCPILYKLRAQITSFSEANANDADQQGQIEILKDELVLIDEVLAAPTRPMKKNYEKMPSFHNNDAKISGASLKH